MEAYLEEDRGPSGVEEKAIQKIFFLLCFK